MFQTFRTRIKLYLLCLLASVFMAGCVKLPDQITPVQNFDLTRYLGKWYEVARIDNRFERGLSQVTAEYSLNSDGSVEVKNRGYSQKKQAWKEAIGKAKFVGESDTGHLKVSFFGPFYGSYAVFALDQENYQYAFVSGNNKDYLWLLSRQPVVSEQIKTEFLQSAETLGFDVDKIIFVAK